MIGLDSVNNFVQITADFIELQFSIVGTDGVAVLGTGPYKNNIGTQRPKGCYFSRSMHTKESYFIPEPRVKGDCTNCEDQKICPYSVVFCSPITRGSEVLGVTGLLGYEIQNPDFIIEKKQELSTYVKELANWFSKHSLIKNILQIRKLSDQDMIHLFNLNGTEGIIITDPQLHIVKFNQTALNLLGCNIQDIMFNKPLNTLVPTNIIKNLFNQRSNSTIHTLTLPNAILKLTVRNPYPIEIGGGLALIVENLNRKSFSQNNFAESRHPKLDFMIGNSKALENTKELIKKAAPSNMPILIEGENGTGKELIAEAIHSLSSYSSGPLIKINCAAIPENLAESELFGYEKGAFTGALSTGKMGKFELAKGGTLFLDEIGELSLAIQSKLLRVLENKELFRVGGTKPIQVDIRIISATNLPLEKLIHMGRFREDLYYRLNVIPLKTIPLRNRMSDIPELVQYFLELYKKNNPKTLLQCFSPNLMEFLTHYSWPGNIRQLKNLVEYLCTMALNEIAEVNDLPSQYLAKIKTTGHSFQRGTKITLWDVEQAISLYGRDTEGKKQAAKHLGISLPTLYRVLKDKQKKASWYSD